jgi:prephenate dehydratase
MDGHAEDKPIKEALDDLDMQARFLKVLGSYPACREVL